MSGWKRYHPLYAGRDKYGEVASDSFNESHNTSIQTEVHQDPVMSSGDQVNVNRVEEGAVQGGNFVNSTLHHPIFNIVSPAGSLFSQNYQKVTFIGRGSFGEAWKVQPKHVNTSQEFMMKEISCNELDVDAGKNEIEMLRLCRHEGIVCYFEDFYEESKLLIIMEFCDGGTLAKFIAAQKTKLLPVDFIMEWLRQLASGVCFIHQKKIIHRDLKPANIFLTSDKRLKIGDFGIAKKLDETCGYASTFVGTAVYIAPEIHGGEKYDMMADMWSLGVIFYEIATLKNPFHGKGFLLAVCQV